MSDHELERLVWRRIDGDLSPDDRSRLERRLERDPEACQQARQIEELASLLDSSQQVEPPLQLRPRIDSALASARAPWSPRPPLFRPARAGSWPMRVAYLAAGVLLGLVATLLLLPGPQVGVSPDHVAATMGAASADEVLDLALGEGEGTLTLRRKGADVAVDLVLATPEEVELVLAAERGALRLEGVAHEGGATSEVRLSGGELAARVTGAGEHRFSLRLDDPHAPVDVSARRQGRLLATGRIGAGTGGATP